MSEQLQLRRGTASQVAAFTGAQGELVVDTTNNRVVVCDGATAGGFAAAKLNETQFQTAEIGVGTAPDPNNPLSVYGPCALFNGVSFNFTLNKSAAANTASVIFEDAFSGRAQIGLCGDDNFSFKVSPDGSAWTTAISLDKTTGAASFAGAALSSGVGGIGYKTGAGGTVSQSSSKATAVTLNKPSGQITMNGASLAAGAIVSFTLTDSAIAANDLLVLNHVSGGTPGAYTLNAQCAAGSALINVRNATAAALAEAIVIAFALVKGAAS